MIVIDASVALEFFVQGPARAAIQARLSLSKNAIHAPHLIDVEFAQSLRRWLLLRNISEQRAGAAMTDWQLFRVTRHHHGPLLSRIWELRSNYTAYDAAYIALAESMGAPLITRDRKLANAPKQHAVQFEVI